VRNYEGEKPKGGEISIPEDLNAFTSLITPVEGKKKPRTSQKKEAKKNERGRRKEGKTKAEVTISAWAKPGGEENIPVL